MELLLDTPEDQVKNRRIELTVDPDPERGRALGSRRLTAVGVWMSGRWGALLASTIVALAGWSHRWMAEDGFIYLRVVDNVVRGYGPVFNPGERVEVATSPAWTAMLSAVHALGLFRLEGVAVVLGCCCAVAGVYLMARASVPARGDASDHWVVPVGMLGVVALPPMWDFATSGLETGLGLLWLGGSVRALGAMCPTSSRRSVLLASLLLGLGPVVRPDFAVVSAVLLAASMLRSRPRGWGIPGRLVAAGAIPVMVQLARMAYYGQVLPNTVVAKHGVGVYWAEGWRYLVDFATPYHLWLPALGLAILLVCQRGRGSQRERLAPVPAAAASVLAGVAHGLFVIRGGGDYMHARLLLPSVFLIAGPVAVRVPRAADRALVRVAAGTAVLVWALLVGISERPPLIVNALAPTDVANRFITTGGYEDNRLHSLYLSGADHPILLEDFRRSTWYDVGRRAADLRRGSMWLPIIGDGPGSYTAPPLVVAAGRDDRRVLVTTADGVIGMKAGSDVLVVDRLGLAWLIGSHLSPNVPRAGHRRFASIEWVLASYGATGSELTKGPSGQALATRARTDAARRTLECEPVRDLVAAGTAPLTRDRLIDNLFGAWNRTFLEIPDDPVEAQRKLC